MMKKAIRVIYWLVMSSIFLLICYREHMLNKLNRIDID